jgi:hypothetical protein
MRYIKTLAIAAATSWLITGCAGTSVEQQQAYDQALSAAEAAYQKALSVDFAWRDSGDLIKAAKEAAAKGEIEKATGLANESRNQSELAYNQYLEQKDAGVKGIR